jgi:putative intracellular protease/amidase
MILTPSSIPGGHGPLWDLTNDEDSIRLIIGFWNSKKPIAAICHAPCVLLNVYDEDGNHFLKHRKVTGFSDTEEEAVQLTKVVPFLLEDELKSKGAIYTKKENWAPYMVRDSLLVTGQNPASSISVAEELVKILEHI